MKPRPKSPLAPRAPGSTVAIGLVALALAVALLGMVATLTYADGGGWPTATPLKVTPVIGKDVLPPTPTPVIQGDAPLPENKAVLPDVSIQSDQANGAPAPPSEAVQSRGINLRLLAIGGGIAAGLLLVVLMIVRLRT